MNTINLCFELPEMIGDSFTEEFFVGIWHPTANLEISVSESIATSSVKGRNWAIVSSDFPFSHSGNGLVHTRSTHKESAIEKNDSELVVFRGYILEPAIHTWSQSEDILNYWQQKHYCHNGVFATVMVGDGGNELKLITDAFGIATLYYREFSGGILFSTNTRFLKVENDQLDKISASILMHCGSVYGNRTLSEGVSRVPPGTVMRCTKEGESCQRWFSYSSLPTGAKPITLSSLRNVEDAFQTSMERCLRLQTSGYVLPLSSGYDSRRILAALHSRKVPFSSLTVRVLQKENRDLDGYWASVMAKDLDFEHQVVELPAPEGYAHFDSLRSLLVDSHGTEHTWFLAMSPYLPQKSCLIFDGLGGDVFGNTGFGVAELHTTDENTKIHMIMDELFSDKFKNIFKTSQWPNIQLVRESLSTFLEELPDGKNKSDLAFLWMRCRSGPGMCFQRLIPAGNVTVYPYFDLDYVQLTLDFDPLEKIPPNTIQARCLAKFWPRYFAFPGSRSIPSETKPGNPMFYEALNIACLNRIKREAGLTEWLTLRRILKPRAFAISCLSLLSKRAQYRISWWLGTLLLMVQRDNNKKCWSIGAK